MIEKQTDNACPPTRDLVAAALPRVSVTSGDSPERRQLLLWCTLGFGGLFLLLSAALNLRDFSTSAKEQLRVFGTFWASGWAASHHLNPYAVYPLTLRIHPFPNGSTVADLNLSPPALLPFFQVWASINPEIGVRIWTFFSVLLFLASAALLMREYGNDIQHRQLFWLLLGPSALDTILMGQDYAIFLTLAVGVWLLLRREKEIGAGICLGILVAAKPNYALWPIFLAFCGHMRLAKTAFLTIAILCCAPLLFYGPAVYMDWLHAVSHDPHWLFPSNISIFGVAARFGHPFAGRLLSIAVLVFSCILVFWKRPSAEISSGVALSLAILASPVAWVHYSLLLAPILFRRPWTAAFTFAIAPLLLPSALLAPVLQGISAVLAVIHLSDLTTAMLSSFYFLPVCFLLAYFLRATVTARRSQTAPCRAMP